MFEQAVVSEGRGKSRSAATLPVSIGLHVMALSSAMLAAVWQVDFPKKSPDQFEQFQPLKSISVPQGSPERPRPRPATAKPARPRIATVDAPPTLIPDETKISEAPQPAGPFDPAAFPNDAPASTGGGDDFGDGPVGQPTGTPQADATFTVGGDVRAPVLVKRVDPSYPALGVKMRRQGVVILQAIIDREGNVRDVQVLRSPHPVFNDAATEAVSKWKFKPGTLHGHAVTTQFNLTVTFTLNS